MNIEGQGIHGKRVLMICYHFPPSTTVGAMRSRKFVKYLGDYGWGCEIITPYRGGEKEYPADRDIKIHHTPNIEVEKILEFLVRTVHTVRNWMVSNFRKMHARQEPTRHEVSPTQGGDSQRGGLGVADRFAHLFFFPDSKFLWIVLALPRALWTSRKCDVIYSSLNPYSSHVLALILAKVTRKPWIADYRDEWVLQHTFVPATKHHGWLAEKLDRACVRNAKYVINVTEPRTKMFADFFEPPPEKLVTIQNGFDEDDISTYQGVRCTPGIFTVTSIGSLYGGRDARPFLQAVTDLIHDEVIDRDTLRINIIGGAYDSLLEKIEALGIHDVVNVKPRIPHHEALSALASSNLAILFGSEMEKVAMTTKLYEYAGMNKAIFAIVPEGPVSQFVQSYGGWCAEINDISEIRETFKKIYVEREEHIDGFNADPDFVKQYTRREQTRQLSVLLNKCAEDFSK